MTILDRYLLKESLQNLAMVLASLAALYLLVDFFERIDNFLQVKLPLSLAARYFLLKVPLIIQQLMPVSILLAGVITLGLLNHRQELIALKAGGVSLNRVLAPILLAGVLASAAVMAMSQWVLPVTVSVTDRIWYERVNENIPHGTIRKGRFFFRGQQGFYSFDQPYTAEQPFRNFSYLQLNDQFDAQLMLTAHTAKARQNEWLLLQGQVQRLPAGQEPTIEMFDQLRLVLPEGPGDFFIPEYKYEEMSLATLFATSRSAAGERSADAWRELQARLSYLVLGLPLLSLGLPMLIIIHQRWGRDLVLAVPASCGLAFATWIWWGSFQSLAKAGYLNPLPASWSMHLLAGGLGLVLLRRLNT